MGNNGSCAPKERPQEYQDRPNASFRQGPNGPTPDTLEDVRQYFGMSQDEFKRLILRSVGGAPGPSQADDVLDLAIVGGGPGGAYTAYRAHKEFPKSRIVLFEKTDHLGGRLMSKGHHSKVREELGGMRIFPSVMQNLVELVNECELNLMPVPLTDAHNIFYYKYQHTEKGKFNINGRSPGQMADACVAAYHKAHPEDNNKDPYLSAELRSLCLRKFFLKYGATEEEVDAWYVYSGYDLYPDNVACSIFVKDGELYGAKLSGEQKYVHEGFQTLVKQLFKKSTAKCEFNTKVLSVGFDERNDVYEVAAADRYGHTKIYKAKNVLVSLPYDQMTELADSLAISPIRKETIKNVQMLPLFKCFLQWEEKDVWWKSLGFDCGKSATDLQIRQCHYYDENDILCYNSGPNAVYWQQQFEYDEKAAARKIFEQLKELHKTKIQDMPEPIWENTLYKFWPDGSHKWKVNVDVYDSMKTICHGKKDGSRLFLCGDAFSGYQGWVVGAIQTADICWEELKKTM